MHFSSFSPVRPLLVVALLALAGTTSRAESIDGEWRGRLECSAVLPGIPSTVPGPYGAAISVWSHEGRLEGKREDASSEDRITGSISGDRISVNMDGRSKRRPAWWTTVLSGSVRDGQASLAGPLQTPNGLTKVRNCTLALSSVAYEAERAQAQRVAAEKAQQQAAAQQAAQEQAAQRAAQEKVAADNAARSRAEASRVAAAKTAQQHAAIERKTEQVIAVAAVAKEAAAAPAAAAVAASGARQVVAVAAAPAASVAAARPALPQEAWNWYDQANYSKAAEAFRALDPVPPQALGALCEMAASRKAVSTAQQDLRYCQDAAAAEDPAGMVALGQAFLQGNAWLGVEKNETLGLGYLAKAVIAGYPVASDVLCVHYYGGSQYARAAPFCKVAAAAGLPRGLMHLALMSLEGKGTVQDFEKGRKLALLSASMNHAQAYVLLGNLANADAVGRKKDPVAAYAWYALAAAAAPDDDRPVHLRDAIGLDGAKTAQAQKLASGWKLTAAPAWRSLYPGAAARAQ